MRKANWTDRRIHTLIMVHITPASHAKFQYQVFKIMLLFNDFDLHIFQFTIDFVILGSFLLFKFSKQPRHRFAYQKLDNF